MRHRSMSQASPITVDCSSTLPPSKPGIFQSPARTLLGLIFVYGAFSKFHFNGAWHFRDYYFFLAMAIGSYRTLPLGLVQRLALILPWLELAVGTLLVAGTGTRWVSLVSTALLAFMVFLPRAAILGLVGHSNPAAELVIDFGCFLVALTVTLRAFHSHGAGQRSN
jgi:methylamine utilization protein MauE